MSTKLDLSLLSNNNIDSISNNNIENKLKYNTFNSNNINKLTSYHLNKGYFSGTSIKLNINNDILNIPSNGTYIYPNGFIYKGEFKNGKIHGIGELRIKKYNNEKSDNIISENENDYILIYKGNFINGQIYGNGYKKYNNTEYWGNFIDGHMNGQGKFIEKNNTYDGEFKDNKKHGYGRLVYANKDIYEGEFKDNNIYGNGKFICNDGIYEGNFKNGIKNGEGKFNGNLYSFNGEYDNNKFIFGEWKYNLGTYKYIGNFNNGIPSNLPTNLILSLSEINSDEQTKLNIDWLKNINERKNKIQELLSLGYTFNVPVVQEVDLKKKPNDKDAKAVKPKEVKKADEEKDVTIPSLSVVAGEKIPTFSICLANTSPLLSQLPFNPNNSEPTVEDKATELPPLGIITEESGRIIECRLVIPTDIFGDVAGVEDVPIINSCSCLDQTVKCDYQNLDCKSKTEIQPLLFTSSNGIINVSNLSFNANCPGDISVFLEFTDITPDLSSIFDNYITQIPKLIVSVTISEGEHSAIKPGKGKEAKAKKK